MAVGRPFGRVVEQLEFKLRAATDVTEQRLHRVQLAGVSARLGRLDEARQLVARLRSENASYEPRLSAWIMYTEGLITHFESLNLEASRDWMRRAHAVSVAAGDTDLRAITLAWLADFDFRLANLESAVAHLTQSFELSNGNSHEARGRACLVLADMASWAGMTSEVKDWFRSAREHAIEHGDIGMQSVVLYNSVSFRVTPLVVQDCFGGASKEVAAALKREVQSVSNLDSGLGIRTLSTMIPALLADLATVLGEWQSAVAEFGGFITRIQADGQQRRAARYLAQRAWCLARLERFDEARLGIADALAVVEQCLDLDDLAVAYARVGATFRLLGDASMSEHHSELARRCLAEFNGSQRRMRALLVGVLDIARSQEKENPALGRV